MENYFQLFFVVFTIFQPQRRTHGAMVVTIFDDREELSKMFKYTEKKIQTNHPDPLKIMPIAEKHNLWEQILASTYFVSKNKKNGGTYNNNFSREILRTNRSRSSVESSSALYGYKSHPIYIDGTILTERYTVLCLAESKGIGFKDSFHIFYAYRPSTYFIGESNYLDRINLVGLTEPRAVEKVFESQEKLEEFFKTYLPRTAGSVKRNRIFQLSSEVIGMTSVSRTDPTMKQTSSNVCDLSVMEMVRLCGQVFQTELYQKKAEIFFGRAQNVTNCGDPLLVSFRSERFSSQQGNYSSGIGCLISRGNKEERMYYVANASKMNNDVSRTEEKFESAVFVFESDGKIERKVYIDSFMTEAIVLIPDNL